MPGLPWYPTFTRAPGPVAPVTPNEPCPLSALTSGSVLVVSEVAAGMKTAFGTPEQYSNRMLDSLAFAFVTTVRAWIKYQKVVNVLGTGPVPATAVSRVGPVVGGFITDQISWRWVFFINLPVGVLAAVIIGFSAWSLATRQRAQLGESRRWMVGAGVIAGVLGGAYGMNGPPLVVYGALRRWDPPRFRATLQAYFLPASALGLVGYAATGLVGQELLRDVAWCLPGAAVAINLVRAAVACHAGMATFAGAGISRTG